MQPCGFNERKVLMKHFLCIALVVVALSLRAADPHATKPV